MKNNTQKGFSLIELITVLGIFSVLTAITVFNYTKFRSETILTNMAYEIALSIREAQIYGVSARNAKGIENPDFKLPYGILFLKDSNQYFLFADTNSDNKFTGDTCANTSDTCITPYTMQQNITVTEIACSSNNVKGSFLFKRPNPEPIFEINSPNDKQQITISAPNGSKRYIVVYNNGQVTVENQTQCN